MVNNKEHLGNILRIFSRKSSDKQLDINYFDEDRNKIAMINICRYQCFSMKDYYIVSYMRFNDAKSDSYMSDNIDQIVNFLAEAIDLYKDSYSLDINNIEEIFDKDFSEVLKESVRNKDLKLTILKTDTHKLDYNRNTCASDIAEQILNIWKSNGTYDKIDLRITTDLVYKDNIIMYFYKVDECNAYSILLYNPSDDVVEYALDITQFQSIIANKIESLIVRSRNLVRPITMEVECYKREDLLKNIKKGEYKYE